MLNYNALQKKTNLGIQNFFCVFKILNKNYLMVTTVSQKKFMVFKDFEHSMLNNIS